MGLHDADKTAFDALSGRRGKIGTFASRLVLIERGGAWAAPIFPSYAVASMPFNCASVELRGRAAQRSPWSYPCDCDVEEWS